MRTAVHTNNSRVDKVPSLFAFARRDLPWEPGLWLPSLLALIKIGLSRGLGVRLPEGLGDRGGLRAGDLLTGEGGTPIVEEMKLAIKLLARRDASGEGGAPSIGTSPDPSPACA